MTEHINEERLSELANNPLLDAHREEDEHISDCERCMKHFVELLEANMSQLLAALPFDLSRP
jgi:hypothetical protein